MYKVFDERDGTEIDDDECLLEYGKLGGILIIGLQWEPIATSVPTPVAPTTICSLVATTFDTTPVASPTVVSPTVVSPTVVSPTVAAPSVAASAVDTFTARQTTEIQEDDVYSSSFDSQWIIDDDVADTRDLHGIGQDSGESSNTSFGATEPTTRKRSLLEELLDESKKQKTDGKYRLKRVVPVAKPAHDF